MAISSTTKIGAAIVVGGVLLAATFVAGVRIGAGESTLLQSTVNGALLVGELRALRAGEAAKLIQAKELELDAQILNFHRLESNAHPWLFWPDSNNFEHERYLRNIASYRREFSPVMPALGVPGFDQVSEEMRQANEDVASTTRSIITRYGK
jgi:hypothetical protein